MKINNAVQPLPTKKMNKSSKRTYQLQLNLRNLPIWQQKSIDPNIVFNIMNHLSIFETVPNLN